MVAGKRATASTKPRQDSKPDTPKLSGNTLAKRKKLGEMLVQQIIDEHRNQRDLWVKMAEAPRNALIERHKERVETALETLSFIIANEGHPYWRVGVAEFKGVVEGKQIKLSLTVPYTLELVDKLMEGEKLTITAHMRVPIEGPKAGVIGSLGLKDPEHPEKPLKIEKTVVPDAEAQLGRGPVKSNEAMPGDTGPMAPAAAPVDGDGNPLAHDPQTGEAQEPAHG
jgi:hypothetical protein